MGESEGVVMVGGFNAHDNIHTHILAIFIFYISLFGVFRQSNWRVLYSFRFTCIRFLI